MSVAAPRSLLALILVALCAIVLVTAASTPADTTGLVLAYGFEHQSGSAIDSSGNGNAGTLSGPVTTAAGRFGQALSFDGVNDLVNVADSSSLDLTTAMTLEAWVRPEGTGWRTALLKERPGGLAYSLYSSTDTGRPSGEVRTTATRRDSRDGRSPHCDLVAPGDDLRRDDLAPVRQRRPGLEPRALGLDRGDERRAADRREPDLGRVFQGRDRRGAHLPARAERRRAPGGHEQPDRRLGHAAAERARQRRRDRHRRRRTARLDRVERQRRRDRLQRLSLDHRRLHARRGDARRHARRRRDILRRRRSPARNVLLQDHRGGCGRQRERPLGRSSGHDPRGPASHRARQPHRDGRQRRRGPPRLGRVDRRRRRSRPVLRLPLHHSELHAPQRLLRPRHAPPHGDELRRRRQRARRRDLLLQGHRPGRDQSDERAVERGDRDDRSGHHASDGVHQRTVRRDLTGLGVLRRGPEHLGGSRVRGPARRGRRRQRLAGRPRRLGPSPVRVGYPRPGRERPARHDRRRARCGGPRDSQRAVSLECPKPRVHGRDYVTRRGCGRQRHHDVDVGSAGRRTAGFADSLL